MLARMVVPATSSRILAIQASAWADSSAGMMPSVREHSWNASTTSASVTGSCGGHWRQVRKLGTDARIVEAGRDRLGFEHLSPFVLHQVALRAVHDAGNGTADRSTTGRLGTDQLSFGIGEPGENACCIGAASDASDDIVGYATVEQLGALLAGLVADDTVELTDHPRVRVRPHDRAEVVGVLDGRDPVAHCLVDGVLERLAARLGGPTSAPSSCIRKTLSFWRSMSTVPM